MVGGARVTVDALASATPVTRDRFVDFLRVASLVGVILGHFTMAVVFLDPHSDPATIEFTNVLELAAWTRWGTLVLQVMPIFFVVGGFAHAVSLRSLRAKGGGYADFVNLRISRLVRPALVFVSVWVVIGFAADAWVGDRLDIGPVLQIAGQFLWFIGIYLIAAAFAPPLLRAHRRFGWRALAVLAGAAVLVDVMRLGMGIEGVKWLNFAFVWLALHQLGFFYADGVAGRVDEPRRGRLLGATLVGVGVTTIVLLGWLGPYGVTMVSFKGEELSNLAPPTVVLLAFGVAQVGVLLLVRAPVTRWLARPRVWRGVIVGGAVAMTAFLWHFTALILVFVALWVAGVTVDDAPTTAAFWWTKAALLLPFLVVVTGLVALWRRFDRTPGPASAVSVTVPTTDGAPSALMRARPVWLLMRRSSLRSELSGGALRGATTVRPAAAQTPAAAAPVAPALAAPRTPLVGPSVPRALLAAVGVAAAIVGMIGFAAVGFRGLASGYLAHVVGVPMTSWTAAGLVASSAIITWLAARPRRGATA